VPASESPAVVAFIGLGNMGRPMAARLVAAGWDVRGFDADHRAREAFQEIDGGVVAADLNAVATNATTVVLMLPSSTVVNEVLLGGGVLAAMSPGSLLVDMGSSEPRSTQALASEAARTGIAMIDAPVSGGVAGAIAGTLTVMVGAAAADIERARPMLELLSSKIVPVGPVGAGHAVKAINNLLSATHLLGTLEAIELAAKFGLDPATVVAAVNGSSGRSGSTEVKLPKFVLTESYDSGFALRLMLKDVGIAVDLAKQLDVPAGLAGTVLEMWTRAASALAADADHTELARWVAGGEADA
jgi:3-hydroxyisobutyrate dehydrogenase